MRWCIIVAVVGLGGVAVPTRGQPPAVPKGAKLENLPAPQTKGRLVTQPPLGPARGQIRVEFRGQLVRVESSRDVSNAVLEYSDGARQKFDDLDGRLVELRGTGPHLGKEVVRAWVKSGANLSGDGPGYGQKFERSRTPQ